MMTRSSLFFAVSLLSFGRVSGAESPLAMSSLPVYEVAERADSIVIGRMVSTDRERDEFVVEFVVKGESVGESLVLNKKQVARWATVWGRGKGGKEGVFVLFLKRNEAAYEYVPAAGSMMEVGREFDYSGESRKPPKQVVTDVLLSCIRGKSAAGQRVALFELLYGRNLIENKDHVRIREGLRLLSKRLSEESRTATTQEGSYLRILCNVAMFWFDESSAFPLAAESFLREEMRYDQLDRVLLSHEIAAVLDHLRRLGDQVSDDLRLAAERLLLAQSMQIKLAAAGLLGKCGKEGSIPSLSQLLSHESDSVRYAAARTIMQILRIPEPCRDKFLAEEKKYLTILAEKGIRTGKK